MVPAHPVTRIICLIGPTASGKSELALKLAQSFDGEIVNADSRQFYRELNIGTAKPTPADRALAPHHLVDCASIASPWDVAGFARAAKTAISEVVARGKLPIVVGGTGLYVRCLLFGLAEIPEIPAELTRRVALRLATEGLEALYIDLRKLDPVGAERLHPTDTQRISRALEVITHTGRPIHEFWQSRTEPLYDHLTLGLNPDRAALYRAIDARVSDMAKRGLREEAAALFAAHQGNPVLNKTIGYAEWAGRGFSKDDEPAVVSDIQANSRHFAKRQATWFRRETHVKWLTSPDGKNAFDEAAALLKTFVERS